MIVFAQPNNVVIGHAAGVPFVALPPLRDRGPDAPIVLAWHLLDPPRTEAAFAAAVPLAGLDAWRVYLGLPMSGSRTVGGGHEEFMRLLFVDPVLNVHRPVAGGAIDEFAAAFDELRERLGVDGGPIGVMGGSMGGAVAQLAIIECGLSVQAAVLINPVTRLHDTVDALAVHHGMSYTWTETSSAFARRLDFVARSDELAALQHPPAILVITGEDDLDAAFRTPMFFAAFAAMLLGNVLFLTGVWHYSILRAGLALTPGPIAAAIFAPFAGKLAQRIGPGVVGGVGALLFGVGSIMGIALIGLDPTYWARFFPAMLVGGSGVGLALPAFTIAATSTLSPQKLATGIGAQTMFRQIGATLGVATFVAILGTPTAATVVGAYNNTRWFMVASAAAAATALALITHRRPGPTAAPVSLPVAAPSASGVHAERA